MFYIDFLRDFGLSDRQIAIILYIIARKRVKLERIGKNYTKDLEKLVKIGILNN
jgi:hypothetical protein